MEKYQLPFKTRGMNRDLSVSAFSPEFSFENINLRLTTNEQNTSLSWVNERGPKKLSLEITEEPWKGNSQTVSMLTGIPLGTAVINHRMVVFTTTGDQTSQNTPDRIYVLEYADAEKTKLRGKLVYKGNLNFSLLHPLETLTKFEANHIQKVYWTDGYNQPRLINIACSDEKIQQWRERSSKKGVDTYFDFVPSFVAFDDSHVTITKNNHSGGLFSPGVIQYAFSYVNRYGQQSNLVYVSPQYYLTHSHRGASPEDSQVTCSFTIRIEDCDQNFDYIRLYSIQRTSLNTTPHVKLLADLPVAGNKVKNSYSVHYIYSEDATCTYPVLATGRVSGVSIENGSCTVTVTPYSTTSAARADARFTITTESGTQIMTLQTFLNAISSKGSLSNYQWYQGEYYTTILLDQEFEEYILPLAENLGGHSWKLQVDDEDWIDGNQAVGGLALVYDYVNQQWWLSNQSVKTEIIKNTETEELVVEYEDNGTTGSNIDPTELLFIGGKEITALTMSEKDGTLFLGNISQQNILVTDIQKWFREYSLNTDTGESKMVGYLHAKPIKVTAAGSIDNHFQLGKYNQREVTTFKGGETYRFGFQLQKHTGEWSEPVWLGDKENHLYPLTEVSGTELSLQMVEAKGNIPLKDPNGIAVIDTTLYQSIRPVIVYPTIADRTVLCQGVLNPTVFNIESRANNAPFAQPSWYFRPYYKENAVGSIHLDTIASVENQSSPFATQQGYKTPVGYYYVTLVTVNEEQVTPFLNTGLHGSLQVEYQTSDGQPHPTERNEAVALDYTLAGGIVMGKVGTNCILALLTSEMVQPQVTGQRTGEGTDTIAITTVGYEGIIGFIGTTDQVFAFYSGKEMLQRQGLFYMNYAEAEAEPYKFIFQLNDTYYQVTFNYLENAYTLLSSITGTSIAYKHYDSLPFEGTSNPKAVEIQGSKQVYKSVYEERKEQLTCNNQYFIDHSIVTLNSPDLQWDNDVQTYDHEGLTLKIVGAIPITANAASHHITKNSDQLPTNHNLGSGKVSKYGNGEKQDIVWNVEANVSDRHLVAEYLWHDSVVKDATILDEKDLEKKYPDGIYTDHSLVNYLIYPWHRTGPLNNDFRTVEEASSWLRKKVESNLLYSTHSIYGVVKEFEDINTQVHLEENGEIYTMKLPTQRKDTGLKISMNYYPNIDQILYNTDGYKILTDSTFYNDSTSTLPVSMRYKSGTHALIGLNAIEDKIPILPYLEDFTEAAYSHPESVGNTFWRDSDVRFSQDKINRDKLTIGDYHDYLWLGELCKKPVNRFGGISDEALRANIWYVAGSTIPLSSDVEAVSLVWNTGDTFYQRFDCLKTYPFTQEDTNQLIEILSFMCESHVNLDGRFDRNRGQIDNTAMTPANFNWMNDVYRQMDNYFTGRIINTADVKELSYPNQVVYTMTQNSGADVDEWTHISMGSTLELEGSKGTITSLQRLNNQLIVFQETGISQILYNENVQIASQEGVPIEIANSQKVQGQRYISDTIGCCNKWSVVNTPQGIYFMDSNDKSIFRFNGELTNLSSAGGFNAWSKQNILSGTSSWTPYAFGNFVGYYDKQNQDVLFINKQLALAYSEKVNAFTSFYNYGKEPYLVNFEDTGIWLHPHIGKMEGVIDTDPLVPINPIQTKRSTIVNPKIDSGHTTLTEATSLASDYATDLYKHQAGNYCQFFGANKPYSMTLVGNPQPLSDKLFTNIEMHVSVDGDGEYNEHKNKFTPELPFDVLEVWNEYQHGISQLKHLTGRLSMQHYKNDGVASLKRKFRVWRCDIPRDNAPLSSDTTLGISRVKAHPMDRIRNQWVYLKLQKDKAPIGKTLDRTEIHHVVLDYWS